MQYAELQVTTNFSFLRGASHPEEMVEQADSLGYTTIGITDRNTLAGVVRAFVSGKKQAIRTLVGCRLDLLDGLSLLVYPTTRDAYSRLSNLLTVGNLRAEKGECHLYKADVYAHAKGMKLILLPPDRLNKTFAFDPQFEKTAREYKEAFGNDLYLAATRRYSGDDGKQLFRLSQVSAELNIPLVATNDVHYHH
ncbi:MAG: PHP domain-containing protein, partial [Bacteroidota bacterium]|nr:PHP domain-containing protein [Bacteroidota bacterium]